MSLGKFLGRGKCKENDITCNLAAKQPQQKTPPHNLYPCNCSISSELIEPIAEETQNHKKLFPRQWPHLVFIYSTRKGQK